ncbi:hypothetical protein CTEN210_12216 [Chaetoceros tenuissimus]|uniref:Leucine-rich repeat domain-containing protein n=1 Tax=Chaetoceros tenuissimus TaxID=426638 RepID=A0AAD3D2W9_9STRA|nr:hypothetical protein CTEN210_12216 [Chaetoceros tenuissimus]
MVEHLIQVIYDGMNFCHASSRDALSSSEMRKLPAIHLTISEGVESIRSEKLSQMPNLKKVTMSNSIRSIAREAFIECYNLEEVEWSSNLAYIMDYAFCGCRALGKHFGSTDFLPPSCRFIGAHAFSYCESIKTIIIPEHTEVNVTSFNFSNLCNHPNGGLIQPDWVKFHQHDAFPLHALFAKTSIDQKSIMQHLCNDDPNLNSNIRWRLHNEKDSCGLTPINYLQANPYAD